MYSPARRESAALLSPGAAASPRWAQFAQASPRAPKPRVSLSPPPASSAPAASSGGARGRRSDLGEQLGRLHEELDGVWEAIDEVRTISCIVQKADPQAAELLLLSCRISRGKDAVGRILAGIEGRVGEFEAAYGEMERENAEALESRFLLDSAPRELRARLHSALRTAAAVRSQKSVEGWGRLVRGKLAQVQRRQQRAVFRHLRDLYARPRPAPPPSPRNPAPAAPS
eukprot:tig00001466_g8785.t1